METQIVRLELFLKNESIEFRKYDIKKHPDQEYETVAMFKGYQQELDGSKVARRIYKREINVVIGDYKDVDLFQLGDCLLAHVYCDKFKIKENKEALLEFMSVNLEKTKEEAIRYLDAVPVLLLDIVNEKSS